MARAAARRIPLVGAAIALAPVIRAAAASNLTLANVSNQAVWKEFVDQVIVKYTGIDPKTGQMKAEEALATYLPVAGYIGARKLGLSKPISRALGRFGLRF